MSRTANDDRSDSMNPNNDAYNSSRGLNDDDDDDGEFLVNANASFSRVTIAPQQTHIQIFGFGAVSIEGEAVYGNVKFMAVDNLSRSITSRFEDFLEFIDLPMRDMLRKRLQTKTLALYAVFDPTNSCLPWHVPLDLNDVERTRDSFTVARCALVADPLKPTPCMDPKDLAMIKCISPDHGLLIDRRLADEEAKKVDPDSYLKALRNAIVLPSDAESWGEFSVPYSGRPCLTEQTEIFKYFNNR